MQDFQQCIMCNLHTRSLIRAFAGRSNILRLRLLAEHHLEFLRLKEGCTGSSESTLVKMPHCWKSHVVAHIKVPYLESICYMCNIYSCFEMQFFMMYVS